MQIAKKKPTVSVKNFNLITHRDMLEITKKRRLASVDKHTGPHDATMRQRCSLIGFGNAPVPSPALYKSMLIHGVGPIWTSMKLERKFK